MKAVEKFLAEETSGNSEDLLLLLKEAVMQIAYYRKLMENYELDALTGLPGSTKFHEFTLSLKKKQKTIGVAFFDVNDLKLCNDTMGHKAGDILLQKAAESILHIIKKNVHAFRVGGDEFAVIITDCTQKDIDELLSKWHEKLSELNARDDGIHCSIAIGTAIGDKISDALTLADERMYADKRRIKADKI